MKKRLLVLLLISLLVLTTTLAGCSADTESEDQNEPSTDAEDTTGDETALEEWQKLEKYETPITLTTDRWIGSEEEMESWDNGPYVQWAKENLGIIWKPKFVASGYDEHLEKLQVLAASSDLPDVIADANHLLGEFYNNGFIRVLQDDIERWGSPLTKYVAIEEYQNVYDNAGFAGFSNEEGKFYAIPLVPDILKAGVFEKLFYRQDILEELGYDEPTNIDELEEVLEAYVDQYDDYAFVTEGWLFGTAHQVFSTFDANPGVYYEKDGEIVYGSVQPEVKTALARLRDWYQKGIIASDYDTKNLDEEFSSIAQGNHFMTGGQVWFPGWMQPQLAENVSTGLLAPMPFIADSEGNTGTFVTNTNIGWPAAITTNCEYPEAIIYEMNENFESFLRNDVDLREMFEFKYPVTALQDPTNPEVVAEKGMGEAEYNYTAEEVGPGFLNKGNQKSPGLSYGDSRASSLMNNISAVLDVFNSNDRDMTATLESLEGAQKAWFFDAYTSNGEIRGNSEATGASMDNYQIVKDAIDNGQIKYDNGYSWIYIPEAQNEFWGTLNDLEHTYFHEIIKGERPLDDFDKFVSEWKAGGGELILEQKNEMFQKNQ